MSSPVFVRVTHSFQAPAERVYDAWLTPSSAARFFFATRTGNILRCEIDARVGGGFLVTDRRPQADGDESVMDMEHRGRFLDLDRPRRIVFEFGVAVMPERWTTVAIDIARKGASACELVLTHDMGDNEEAHAWAERSRQGWQKMLKMLERELASRRIGISS